MINNDDDNLQPDSNTPDISGNNVLISKADEENNIGIELENEHNSGIKEISEDIPEEEDNLPSELSIIPMQDRPVFPGIFMPLVVNSSEDIKLIEKAYSSNNFIGLVMTKNDEEVPKAKDLYTVGTAAKIMNKINLPDGGINVFISAFKRFKIQKILHNSSPITAEIKYLEDEEDDTFEVKALMRALISEVKEIAENNPLFPEEMLLTVMNIKNPGKNADYVTSVLKIGKDEQQRILEIQNVRRRLEQVLVFIKKEQELLSVQKKIQNELNEKVQKNQREYFLREEMRSIQEELGTDIDGNATDYQKFKEKIEKLKFKGEVKETAESELEKFLLTEPNSPEYTISRNYLELITQLPWEIHDKENYDLEKAENILEKEHYGLEDVKKRIIEYLAVRKLKNDSKGSIILLSGPPGVGKTSIGKSIAKAMNKPFFRFSVGGMHDEAEIKGHRRTYVGAMCGKIIQGLKITHSKNPVFMIDEVDKIGANSIHGDPASALLEVLDPEQNTAFRDNYLDLPFDVSNVFFILTANTLDSIPAALLDRAEVIQISGYIDQEKIEIARKYLIPKNLSKNGLKKKQVKYPKETLLTIAKEYAREAGVRNYEKSLDKIHRKLVAKIMLDKNKELKEKKIKSKDAVQDFIDKNSCFVIAPDDLEKYLGKPVFDESEIKKADVPGTAIGLAWTSMGGDTLLLESVYFPGKPELILTGQMGNIMKESAAIAMNWAKRYVFEKSIKEQEWFEKNTIHLHIPEGAVPKDGPSAGITMAVTFVSLFSGKKIKSDVAMTGELSLTGQVLPIGGLREKTVAAKRNGIKTILIPKGNLRDLDEIPEHVKAGIKFMPVSKIEGVMDFIFPKI